MQTIKIHQWNIMTTLEEKSLDLQYCLEVVLRKFNNNNNMVIIPWILVVQCKAGWQTYNVFLFRQFNGRFWHVSTDG